MAISSTFVTSWLPLTNTHKATESVIATLVKQWVNEGCNISFSTSFGLEDQVLTHILSGINGVRFFTLDTGRLFPETYETWQQSLSRYKVSIESFSPDAEKIARLVSKKGPYSFYNSIEERKECCFIRKVEPLKKALKNQEIWITGLRASQAATRTSLAPLEWDETHQLVKYHPLLEWTEAELWQFVKENSIPTNSLHGQGFPSIGCQPCTRAIQEGEDVRAGRWWWESPEQKECGLHAPKTVKVLAKKAQ